MHLLKIIEKDEPSLMIKLLAEEDEKDLATNRIIRLRDSLDCVLPAEFGISKLNIEIINNIYQQFFKVKCPTIDKIELVERWTERLARQVNIRSFERKFPMRKNEAKRKIITYFSLRTRMTFQLKLDTALKMLQDDEYRGSKEEFLGIIKELVKKKELYVVEGNKKLSKSGIDKFKLSIGRIVS